MDSKTDPTLKDMLKTALAGPTQPHPRRAPAHATPQIAVKGDRNVVMLRGNVTIHESRSSAKPRGNAIVGG